MEQPATGRRTDVSTPAARPGAAAGSTGHWARQVGALLRGRRVVLVGISQGRLAPGAEQLRQLGAAGVFALSARPDNTPTPDHTPPSATGHADGPPHRWDAGLTAADQDELGRRFDALLREPPPALHRALDTFDPERSAWVLDTRDLPGPTFAGRRRYGWRRPRWTAAEDKVTVGEVWRVAGIAHAPQTVVPAAPEALRAAITDLDRGAGTVLAADARDGLHTGARGTRWLAPGADPGPLATELTGRCHRVRVMPYLEGLPCSVHGLVLPGDVVVLRPLELLTLRRPGGAFVFAGTSTHWTCPQPAHDSIRATARSVGRALRDLYGYRGAFTLDGVLGPDGFLPTEVNARMGSGLNIDRTRPDLMLNFVARMLREGEHFDARPAELERQVMDALEEAPFSEAKIGLDAPAAPGAVLALRRGDAGPLRAARPGESPDATVATERSAVGDRLRFRPLTDTFRGEPLAGIVTAACALAVERLGVRCGPLYTSPPPACAPPPRPGHRQDTEGALA